MLEPKIFSIIEEPTNSEIMQKSYNACNNTGPNCDCYGEACDCDGTPCDGNE